jgi:hypothetical protein
MHRSLEEEPVETIRLRQGEGKLCTSQKQVEEKKEAYHPTLMILLLNAYPQQHLNIIVCSLGSRELIQAVNQPMHHISSRGPLLRVGGEAVVDD